VPRGLAPPEPQLADDAIRLEPLTKAHVPEMLALARDPEFERYTRVPVGADEPFVVRWVERYETGWEEGSRAGFAIRGVADEAFLGFAAVVTLELDALQAEIGYGVVPEARGRGIAGRSLDLLTRWCLGELGLERLELRIDPANIGSTKVAERAGYRLEGVLRNTWVKDGVRSDVGVWSRLRGD
jgi:RimJ/RimL family protein N-acetyltransferase